jgi:2-polyprenyl-3-methyl-5-hydroxy-6-metoxy-1,4-benzoquinol methylase
VEEDGLISPEYRELNAKLHSSNHSYGTGGRRHSPTVEKICAALKSRSVLDYGCGKGSLAKELEFQISEYDPAIIGKDSTPTPADIVVCADVLEHVEPVYLDAVLAELKRLAKCVAYLVIHTGPSTKNLPDGRNSHLTQEGQAWWSERIGKNMEVQKVWKVGVELHYIVGPVKIKV